MRTAARASASLAVLFACTPAPRARLAAGPQVVDGIMHFDLGGGPLGAEAKLDDAEKRLLEDCPWKYQRGALVRGVEGELSGWVAAAPRLELRLRPGSEAKLLSLEVNDGQVRAAVCSPEGAAVVRAALPPAAAAEKPEARLLDLVAQRRPQLAPWLSAAAHELPPIPERADEAWCSQLNARLDEAAARLEDLPLLSARATEILHREGALPPGAAAEVFDPQLAARALARRHLALCR